MTEKDPRSRDMTITRWPRTVRRLRRNAEELRSYDFQVTEPDNLDTPPGRRNGIVSPGVQ